MRNQIVWMNDPSTPHAYVYGICPDITIYCPSAAAMHRILMDINVGAAWGESALYVIENRWADVADRGTVIERWSTPKGGEKCGREN